VSRLALTLFVALSLTFVTATATVRAQRTPPPPPECDAPCLTIVSVGSFLGYLDGFPEYPGFPGDSFSSGPDSTPERQPRPNTPVPYGGVAGVSKWLETFRRDSGLLLVAGNNHPQRIVPQGTRPAAPSDANWFWNRLADLQPAAVAIGGEDIRRLTAQMPAIRAVDWIRSSVSSGHLPFLASNVVIRKSGHGINIVRDSASGMELEIASDESLGPTEAFTLTHSCDVTVKPGGATFADGPAVTATAVQQSADVDSELGLCHTDLQFAWALRPGRTYDLTVAAVRKQSNLPDTDLTAVFAATTDEVLTPHDGAGSWSKLPVVQARRSGVSFAIMAFVSPSLADELPSSDLEWDARAGCAAAKCTLKIMDPRKAAGWWMGLGVPPGSSAPVVLVLSDMFADEDDALLGDMDGIRYLSTTPESVRLGRAAHETAADVRPRYSGDLAFGAVVDAVHPAFTRLIVRPEWGGETASVARAHFAQDGGRWTITAPSVAAHSIEGAALAPTIDNKNAVVSYDAVLGTRRIPAGPGPFAVYCPVDPAGPFDSSHARQGDLWTSHPELTGLVLDQMRRTTGADIAFVPTTWVDDEVVGWLEHEARTGTVNWLSGFILERLLFRSESIVKVAIKEDVLAKTLAALVDKASQNDALCVSGLGLAATCPLTKLDIDDLLVNTRRPQPGHFYSVALPAALARKHNLTFENAAQRQILAPLDARLSGACRPGTPATPASTAATVPLAARLEDELAAPVQHYVKLDPLAFEYALTNVKEPKGAEGLFSKLPTDKSSAKDNRQLVVDAVAEIGFVDTRRFVIKMPATVSLNRKDLEDATSFDSNRFSIGLLAGYKRVFNRRVTAFGGGAVDGEISETNDTVQALRELPDFPDPARDGETLSNVTVQGPKLTLHRKRGFFTYGTAGLELPKYERLNTTITNATFSFDWGRATNVPVGVHVGAAKLPFEDFIMSGAAGVLKTAYTAGFREITADTPFGFEYGSVNQFRFELDGKSETKYDNATLTTSTRARVYGQLGDDPPLAAQWSVLETVAIEWTVWKRWAVAPYVEVHVVGVDETGTFSVTKLGVKLKLASFWKRGHGTLFQ